MNYKILYQNPDENQTTYAVYDGTILTAEFSYALETLRTDDDSRFHFASMNRFWIRSIRLMPGYETYECLEAVLHFIQYKCMIMDCAEIYMCLSVKNLFYIEMLRRYGFYVMASEQKQSGKHETAGEYVFKYSLPESKEERYHHYISRKNRS